VETPVLGHARMGRPEVVIFYPELPASWSRAGRSTEVQCRGCWEVGGGIRTPQGPVESCAHSMERARQRQPSWDGPFAELKVKKVGRNLKLNRIEIFTHRVWVALQRKGRQKEVVDGSMPAI